MKHAKYYLLLILLFAAVLRLNGLNWDQGFHLHPDERAIVMFALPLQFPATVQEFITVESPLNPHFFAYGNFPLYLLKTFGLAAAIISPAFGNYDYIVYIGRLISVVADLGTIIVIYLLAKKLFNNSIALLSALSYSLSVFAIQAAHFYAVDTLLTFFVTTTIYFLIRLYENPSKKLAIVSGVFFGLALVTKISASTLVVAVAAALLIDFVLIFLKKPHHIKNWFPHIPAVIKRLLTEGLLFFLASFFVFIVLQPYAVIDFKSFVEQNMQQQRMTYDAFTFPYTIQYAGKIPYLYELKNIFFFGLGPILAIFSFLGFLYLLFLVFQKQRAGESAKEIVFLTFFVIYFIIVGRFAVGWMRYMLPLYPFFAICAALALWRIYSLVKPNFEKNKSLFLILTSCFLILLLIWPLSFQHIYSIPHTRVTATNWILNNIPAGKKIAVEHWDDALPLSGAEKYTMLTLPLYDQDSAEKWQNINALLSQADYIILSSNRLSTPLPKLKDCSVWPPPRCYPITAAYYENLFGDKLGFKKEIEFSSYPTVPLLNIEINDQNADESFTVYDHPKVIIFKKTAP